MSFHKIASSLVRTFVKNCSRERAARVFSSLAQQKAPAWRKGLHRKRLAHTKKGAYAPFLSNYIKKDNDYACSAERATLPDLRQRVQTFFLGERPFSKTVTRWIFGLNLRLTVRCEWLIERPATACLPQKSQTFDITTSKEARDIAHQFTCAVTMYHIKRSLQSQKGRIWWFGVRSALTALQNITLTLWPESSLRPRPRPHTSYAHPLNIMSLGF